MSVPGCRTTLAIKPDQNIPTSKVFLLNELCHNVILGGEISWKVGDIHITADMSFSIGIVDTDKVGVTLATSDEKHAKYPLEKAA